MKSLDCGVQVSHSNLLDINALRIRKCIVISTLVHQARRHRVHHRIGNLSNTRFSSTDPQVVQADRDALKQTTISLKAYL